MREGLRRVADEVLDRTDPAGFGKALASGAQPSPALNRSAGR